MEKLDALMLELKNAKADNSKSFIWLTQKIIKDLEDADLLKKGAETFMGQKILIVGVDDK